MKEIEIEIETNSADIIELSQYLAGYDSEVNIFSGEYSAGWLLSDVHSSTWVIKTTKTIKKRKNKSFEKHKDYKYVHKINWSRLLPNGTLLTDKCNKGFLELIQKMVFISFESSVINASSSGMSLLSGSSPLLIFISWLYLHESRFEPSKFALSKLTSSDVKQYTKDIINGGAFSALKTAERILLKTGLDFERNLSKDCLSLNQYEVDHVVTFFEEKKFYKYNRKNIKIVNRKKIRNYFNLSKGELYSHRASVFFRQFEPELMSLNSEVLLPLDLTTEMATHKTPLIMDIKEKPLTDSNAKSVVCFLICFFKLSPLFGKHLPKIETFHFNEIYNLIKISSRPKQKTPWIPLDTNLLILNKSIGMILNDGVKIVDYFDSLATYIYMSDDLDSNGFVHVDKSEVARRMVPNSLKHYGIKYFLERDNIKIDTIISKRSESGTFSVNLLIELLIAACLIVISGLKPIRALELTSLKYDCVKYKEGDGFWLTHNVAKSGISDMLPETDKPIPKIAATAIQLLQRLNDTSRKVLPKYNKKESSFLLFHLVLTRNYYHGSIYDGDKINALMSLFCDYVETNVDEYNRRWYANTHELRKSFILTFFWAFKHSSLDACRWIAGHKDPEHVYAYIQANIPGEEMVEVESEYAQQQMRLFNDNASLTEMENTESLYNDVCKHFNVTNVSQVLEKDLDDWITLSLSRGDYLIDVVSLNSEWDVFPKSKILFKLNVRSNV